MLKTAICELFGIEHPIIQGGMAYVATAELVSAVSNAGGLGIIGAGADAIVAEAERIIAGLGKFQRKGEPWLSHLR